MRILGSCARVVIVAMIASNAIKSDVFIMWKSDFILAPFILLCVDCGSDLLMVPELCAVQDSVSHSSGARPSLVVLLLRGPLPVRQRSYLSLAILLSASQA